MFNNYMEPEPKHFTIIEGADVHLVNWCGLDFSVHQIFQAYDTARRSRCGVLVTATSAKDLCRRSRRKKFYYGDLYIKAYTKKYGLWEVTLKDTYIKQLDHDTIWFNHDGISSLQILKKPAR